MTAIAAAGTPPRGRYATVRNYLTVTRLVPDRRRAPAESLAMPAKVDATHIHAMILAAADRQLATAAVARLIIGAGLEGALRDLIAQVAANVANPIADLLEDAAAD